jgi:hypothetical protein
MHTETELTTTEAARRKGVTRTAVATAIREGRLKARIDRKPGNARGTWRIDASSLEAWKPIMSAADRIRNAQTQRWEPEAEAARLAAISAIQGSMKHLGGETLDDFLRQKREDLELEEYRPYRSAADG